MLSWAYQAAAGAATGASENIRTDDSEFEVVDVSNNGSVTVMAAGAKGLLATAAPSGDTGVEVREEDDDGISSSYCAEWERLFHNQAYLRHLRSSAMKGKLRSSRFRSLCWKLYLGVLPESQSEWSGKMSDWRARYEDLKNQLIVNPRGAEAIDLSVNNPLSQEAQSPWNQFFQDNELRLTIKQDVVRTYPKVDFYHRDSIRAMMVDILFMYAKLRPKISYRQGMHELLAPLVFVLYCDHQAFLHACDIESVGELTRDILNPQYLEHDAFAMFHQIMASMEHFYVSKERTPVVKTTGSCAIPAEPFLRMQDQPSSNAIVAKLNYIQTHLLKRFDSALYDQLRRMDIAPQIYGIRWVRLLFGREFPMQDLLLLWDAIFADDFELVDYIFLAMLLFLSQAMQTSDYPSCLHLLMKYPPVSDVQYFIDKALHLRDPQGSPWVMDYQYQKPANFGLNGWEHMPSYNSSHMSVSESGGGRPRSLGLADSSGGKMNKSTSEHLLSDSIPSTTVPPHSVTSVRKGSTASLSQLEFPLPVAAPPPSFARTPAPRSHRGASQRDPWGDGAAGGVRGGSLVEQMVLDGGGSPAQKNGSKLFVFGARGGRQASSGVKQNQAQAQKNGEQERSKATGDVSDMEVMCQRCAAELDVHIETLQKQLLKQDVLGIDDEVFLALAGVKQVRDVLKGVLKPSCAFDTSYSRPTQSYNTPREHHNLSAQSSLAVTPIYEGGGDRKIYPATPDLLSSDTDLNSPENSCTNLNPADISNDNTVKQLSPIAQIPNRSLHPRHVGIPHDDNEEADDITYRNAEVEMGDVIRKVAKTYAERSGSFDDNRNEAFGERSGHVVLRASAGAAVEYRVKEGPGAPASVPVDQARESSPMNRLSGLLKNFTKF